MANKKGYLIQDEFDEDDPSNPKNIDIEKEIKNQKIIDDYFYDFHELRYIWENRSKRIIRNLQDTYINECIDFLIYTTQFSDGNIYNTLFICNGDITYHMNKIYNFFKSLNLNPTLVKGDTIEFNNKIYIFISTKRLIEKFRNMDGIRFDDVKFLDWDD